MGRFLVANTRRDRPLWRSFFMGDALPGSGTEDKPGFGASVPAMVASAVRDVTVPWTLVASALLDAWLMLSRLVFGTEPPMADSDHLVGALVITVAVIAMAEVGRPLRFINIPLGIWLVPVPWLLSGTTTVAIFSCCRPHRADRPEPAARPAERRALPRLGSPCLLVCDDSDERTTSALLGSGSR